MLHRVVAGVRRGVHAVCSMPNPRLTGLGSGLFCAALMLLFACLVRLLFDGSGVVYGVLFLPVSALTALWVRPKELITAPIAVPIAFAVGLPPISPGSEGFAGQLMGVVTELALQAGWLYGGTLIAGVIVIVRKVRLMARKRAARAARAGRAAGTAGRRAGTRGAAAGRPNEAQRRPVGPRSPQRSTGSSAKPAGSSTNTGGRV